MDKTPGYSLPSSLVQLINQSINELQTTDSREITTEKELIEENIKTNLGYPLNDKQDSLIHLLAKYKKVNVLQAIVTFLEKNNLDVTELINLPNNRNYIPLHYAAEYADLSTVEFLCEHQANVNALTEDNLTPLHVAADYGDIPIVDYLVNHGANLEAKTKYKSTVLHYASGATGRSHFELAKHLMEDYGAISYVNAQDDENYTPLHEASHSGDLDLTCYLIEEGGADPTLLTLYGNSVLHMAAVSGNINLVKYLIEKHHAQVNATDNDGQTILHYAVMGNNLDVVKYLIEEHNLDANAVITGGLDQGHNALYLVNPNNKEMMEYLTKKISISKL